MVQVGKKAEAKESAKARNTGRLLETMGKTAKQNCGVHLGMKKRGEVALHSRDHGEPQKGIGAGRCATQSGRQARTERMGRIVATENRELPT